MIYPFESAIQIAQISLSLSLGGSPSFERLTRTLYSMTKSAFQLKSNKVESIHLVPYTSEHTLQMAFQTV